jgi:hypothetical protein
VPRKTYRVRDRNNGLAGQCHRSPP